VTSTRPCNYDTVTGQSESHTSDHSGNWDTNPEWFTKILVPKFLTCSIFYENLPLSLDQSLKFWQNSECYYLWSSLNRLFQDFILILILNYMTPTRPCNYDTATGQSEGHAVNHRNQRPQSLPLAPLELFKLFHLESPNLIDSQGNSINGLYGSY
jgi:hypothetical protein